MATAREDGHADLCPWPVTTCVCGYNRVQFGTVEVSDNDFAPTNVRRALAVMVPESLLATLGDDPAEELVRRAASVDDLKAQLAEERLKSARLEVSLAIAAADPSADTLYDAAFKMCQDSNEDGHSGTVPCRKCIVETFSRAHAHQRAPEAG